MQYLIDLFNTNFPQKFLVWNYIIKVELFDIHFIVFYFLILDMIKNNLEFDSDQILLL